MEGKPKIKLIFYSLFKQKLEIDSYKLSFDNNIHKLDSLEATYEIPEDVFKYGKERTKIFIEFFNSDNKFLNKIGFPVDYCFNNIYLGKDGFGKGYNFEMIFKNFKEINVTFSEMTFNSFDNVGTENRKRLIILNYAPDSLSVNEKAIELKKGIENSSSNFLQYSINCQDFKIIVKEFEDLQLPQLHLLMKKKNFFTNFYNEILKLFNKEYSYNYNNEYYKILNYFKRQNELDCFDFNLHLSNKILDEYFKDNNIDFNIIYYYRIDHLFIAGKKKYSKDKNLFKETVDKLDEFYKTISKEKKLKLYEKIILFYRISILLYFCKDIESLKTININYFIVSECENNSIIKKAIDFYDQFVNDLSEKSKVFPYLLNLDSGIGYYEAEQIYTFDMTNLALIKAHLKELRPKIILFYTLNYNDLAHNIKDFPCIAVNRYNFLKDDLAKNTVFDKYEKDDEDSANDIALNLFVLFYHECMGHGKFNYNKNGKITPKKIINETNDLIELEIRNKFDLKEDGKEYILGSNCINKGDSGSFLELAFGKFRKDLITSLMLKIKGKGNLLKRSDLFTGQNCEILRKYVILKYIAKERNIQISSKNNIEEEIKELETFIDYKELISENNVNSKKDEFQLIGKKRDKSKDKKDDEDSSFDISGKNKKIKSEKIYIENMNSVFNEEKGQSKKEEGNENEDEGEEDEDDDISSESDNSFEFGDIQGFEKLYKKMIRKYQIKQDEFILQRISEKMRDHSVSGGDKIKFYKLLEFMKFES